jgi:hypothetical protein
MAYGCNQASTIARSALGRASKCLEALGMKVMVFTR